MNVDQLIHLLGLKEIEIAILKAQVAQLSSEKEKQTAPPNEIKPVLTT